MVKISLASPLKCVEDVRALRPNVCRSLGLEAGMGKVRGALWEVHLEKRGALWTASPPTPRLLWL